MKKVANIACMRERRGAHTVLVGRPNERDHLEDLRVEGSITLKWIFK